MVARPRSRARARSRRRSVLIRRSVARSSAGRQVAAPGRDRARLQRRADQPDRRVGVLAAIRSARLGQSSSCFDASNAAPPKADEPCGTGCSSTATSRPWTAGRAIRSARSTNGAIGIADGADRARRQADRTGRLPREGGRAAAAAPGSRRAWSIATRISSSAATARARCDAPRRRDL